MGKSTKKTALRIITDQAEELPESITDSIEASVGLLQIQWVALCSELALAPREQSTEKLLQALVSISAVALSAIESHVLPELEEDENE